MPPNIARPTISMIAVETAKTRFSEQVQRQHRLGCAPLDPDERAEQDADDARATRIGEPHAYWVPPQVTASRSEPTATDQGRAQRSRSGAPSREGRSRTTLVTISAAAPSGMLM